MASDLPSSSEISPLILSPSFFFSPADLVNVNVDSSASIPYTPSGDPKLMDMALRGLGDMGLRKNG